MTTTHRQFTFEVISKHFEYDPDTGQLFRRYANGNLREMSLYRVKDGKLEADDVTFRAHYIQVTHIMWMLMKQCWPTPGKVVDHKDREVRNCCWNNLREATPSQSAMNQDKRPRVWTDEEGLERGVYANNSGGYIVRLQAQGRQVHIGTYRTKAEANEVALRERAKLHGEFFAEACTAPPEPVAHDYAMYGG